MSAILAFLQSIIEGGFVGQAIIATIIWGTISLLLLRQTPVDDRLYDGAFIVLGYFFHVAQVAATTHSAVQASKRKDECVEELNQLVK